VSGIFFSLVDLLAGRIPKAFLFESGTPFDDFFQAR